MTSTRHALIALLVVLIPGPLQAREISVIVRADKPPSRDAHFNWVFEAPRDGEVVAGQFACGSPWVAPSLPGSGITLVSLSGNPEWTGDAADLLSCDADPVTERHGLLSGKNNYGSYDAAENILPRLPMTFASDEGTCVSLVAAMQRNEEATGKGGTRLIVGEVVDAYCIVTVMPKAPLNGGRDMIRPNITGDHKEFLTWDDFDLSRLHTHDFLEGRAPEQWARRQEVWRNSTEVFGIATEMGTKRGRRFIKFSEGGRAFRSHILMHDYGAGMARAFSEDVFAMFARGLPLEEKKPALAAMLAFGLDIYHARYNIGANARKRWSCGAGQSLGQFLPPVLAAALLHDETKANRLRRTAVTNHGHDPGELGPQELRQIRRGLTGVLLWGDGHPIVREENEMVGQDWRYWADFTGSKCYDSYDGEGNPNRGKKTAADPYGYIDGPANKPGSAYMGVSLGGTRSFAAAMLLMPQIRSVVNTDAPIEYVDRVTRHGLWTWPDPVAPPAKVDQETARLWWSAQGVTEWQKTWGVRPDDVRFAIENGEGRFRSLHGTPFKGGYESFQVLRNWDRIIALYDGDIYEDSVVPLGTVVAPEIVFTRGDKPAAFLFCATPDATIHFTVDGTDPTADSAPYDKAIPVAPGSQVRAMALADGKRPSAVRSRTFR